MIGDALEDERRDRAYWSWREQPPMVGTGEQRHAMPFDEFWDRLNGKQTETKLPEISDEEIEALMKMGRIGLRPPGVTVKE